MEFKIEFYMSFKKQLNSSLPRGSLSKSKTQFDLNERCFESGHVNFKGEFSENVFSGQTNGSIRLSQRERINK